MANSISSFQPKRPGFTGRPSAVPKFTGNKISSGSDSVHFSGSAASAKVAPKGCFDSIKSVFGAPKKYLWDIPSSKAKFAKAILWDYPRKSTNWPALKGMFLHYAVPAATNIPWFFGPIGWAVGAMTAPIGWIAQKKGKKLIKGHNVAKLDDAIRDLTLKNSEKQSTRVLRKYNAVINDLARDSLEKNPEIYASIRKLRMPHGSKWSVLLRKAMVFKGALQSGVGSGVIKTLSKWANRSFIARPFCIGVSLAFSAMILAGKFFSKNGVKAMMGKIKPIERAVKFAV